jgi:Arc/MetJ-type ribon-helix-helix transcriptional regulator
MKRVQLTLDEKSLAYLKSMVDSGECASLSHAVRKIIARHMQEEKECLESKKEL